METGSVGRLTEFLEDWRYLLRRDGWRSTLTVAVRELLQLPYRHMRFVVLARSVDNPLPDYQPKIELDIRPFEKDDIVYISEIDRPSEAKLCARRLGSGQMGFIAFHNSRPAGHAWASDRLDPTLERVQFPLLPGDGICLDVFTAPAYRGKGVQTALSLARFHFLREQGYVRVVTYIEKQNHPSLGVWQRKLGSEIIGHIDFVRVGPWRRVRYSEERN